MAYVKAEHHRVSSLILKLGSRKVVTKIQISVKQLFFAKLALFKHYA
jgi:hypothetical protein|tara:strand:- start:1641 stop:1781 length:141 start_codon:yes stop_codon:yes gene_type:complete